ncbi:MAG: Tryptophanyl-tRNA synthetase (EC [uncultured Thiotrichaceae bacterium]|uniref:Tryptophan--tRNA ligase n=1 Tax=uncultured Thiotrichaceae bacterium TaxID=298394 RepID=A0A6S6UAE3_9GAMM|nr:MAG: Tryptophanyl-tRNA synthetase (EC [uncultured Thiotrichaceae bacterium]
MSRSAVENERVVSGMRPTGKLHLGHYHGVLKNWIDMQHQYDCFFFIADWHALTTHYETPENIPDHVTQLMIDWLAAGISPNHATMFVQSDVPQHAELHLLLSMMTPLSWLERVPTYKDQKENLKERDLGTYGFLGYPLLQSADILIYKANQVPVGEDQVVHVEMTREVARRFNHFYGQEAGFEDTCEAAISKMGKKNAKMYRNLRRAYQEKGDTEAIEVAHALLESQQNITIGDRERLYGYLEGISKIILPEPDAKLTKASKLPGLDGRKMSKSYNNTIDMREEADSLTQKIKKMPTDPARMRLTDPGDPNKCPVWQFHQAYTDEKTHEWVKEGCTSAGIGCIQCKQPVIDSVQAELDPIRERAKQYENNHDYVKSIIHQGGEAARDIAAETMQDVIEAMRFSHT